MIAMNQRTLDQTAAQNNPPVLAVYCAPWCGFCRHLIPMVKRLSRQYENVITFAQIDIDQEPELARREQIEVVPTLVLYRSGKALGSMVVPECSGQIEAFLRENLTL